MDDELKNADAANMAVTFFRPGADQARLDKAFPKPDVVRAQARARNALEANRDALDKRGSQVDRNVDAARTTEAATDDFAARAAKMSAAVNNRKPGCCAGGCMVQ